MTVDLDRFKAVNDTYGHPAGDQVLVKIAACLRTAVTTRTIVARSGGEEFVVVAHLSSAAAMAEADRLCRAIETASRSCTPVTASIGVAVVEGDSIDRCPERLLHNSDAAMYRAKQLGGNMVVLGLIFETGNDSRPGRMPGPAGCSGDQNAASSSSMMSLSRFDSTVRTEVSSGSTLRAKNCAVAILPW